jgi:hypothetical protein
VIDNPGLKSIIHFLYAFGEDVVDAGTFTQPLAFLNHVKERIPGRYDGIQDLLLRFRYKTESAGGRYRQFSSMQHDMVRRARLAQLSFYSQRMSLRFP